MNKLAYLNLGCGATFHKDWTNIDFVSGSADIVAYNLLKGIPYADNSFEVVYHSHVLEHFPKTKAVDFIKECYRVLKPNGIIRIAIPDLEKIALNYIRYLNESLQGIPGADQKYNWTMLELFDQLVRSDSGGEMIDYIKNTSNNNDSFLLERNGHEVKRIMDMFRNDGNGIVVPSFSLASKLKGIPKRIKNKSIQLLLGKEYTAYRIGKFRLEGEIHQWMYDRYSLKKLLEDIGFKDAQVKSGFESNIPDWQKYNLDGSNGIIRKPDSLFMEAIK
jgi:predicted SAM-dependent methyltransferase